MSSALLRFPWLLLAGFLFYLISASVENYPAGSPPFPHPIDASTPAVIPPAMPVEAHPPVSYANNTIDADEKSLSLSNHQLQEENDSLKKQVLELSKQIKEYKQSFYGKVLDYLSSVWHMDFSNLISFLCGIGQLFIWSWQIWQYYLRNRFLAWKLSAFASFHLF